MPPASLPTPADVARRTLYLYANYGRTGAPGELLAEKHVARRTLYTYVNEGTHGHPVGGEPLNQDDVLRRVLYLYVSIGHDRDPSDVPARGLYTYVAYTNDEMFPWIERILPVEQYRGGQVAIMGDGFGATEAAEGGSVRLGVYDPAVSGPGVVLGVVSWSSRSPGLHPANSGIRSSPAIVVTIPPEADSGMLSVELTT